METVNYQLQMDPLIKSKAEETFSAVGLNLGEAIIMFLQTSIRKKGLPFEFSSQPTETTSNQVSEQQSFQALMGCLSGYDLDLEHERGERLASK